MKNPDDELQERTCRACQQRYPYPLRRSLATRFYCEQCMALPPEVRATFERLNRRINALASEIRQLQEGRP